MVNSTFQINAWLDGLASSNYFVDSLTMGSTYEGRSQKVLRISEAGPGKPNVVIQAGAHSRYINMYLGKNAPKNALS